MSYRGSCGKFKFRAHCIVNRRTKETRFCYVRNESVAQANETIREVMLRSRQCPVHSLYHLDEVPSAPWSQEKNKINSQIFPRFKNGNSKSDREWRT